MLQALDELGITEHSHMKPDALARRFCTVLSAWIVALHLLFNW